MFPSRAPAVDERLVTRLSGPAKLAALIRAQGYTFQRLASEHGLWATQVKLCVYGERPYPAVREILSRVLDLPREEIDWLLDRSEGAEPSPAPDASEAPDALDGRSAV